MAEPLSREEALFHAALEIDAPDQRSAYLDAACGDQRELRRRVEALLRRYAESTGPLDRPVGGLAETMHEPVAERPGTFIGPYRLQEQIGEGGMGLVFVADQQQPIKRRVALKVIKPGMDSKQVIARFEAERQALALMDHPNIAHVLDAGTTDGGRPYFVMELVKGAPITDYCDQHRLTTRRRLGLFLMVCRALQHAHQKGIIHRDLKPSNVLVSVHDVTPVVKIIDFGIAKAMGGRRLTDQSVHTGFSQLVGTPLYMSPEQAGGSGLDVDTRSDIYSLGVLLYELLTGTMPFDAEALKKAGYDELLRIIREEEPPRPSLRLSKLQEGALAALAEQHGVEPRKFSKEVRGELDWIVMKCLEKDRNRRYETAGALARDIERHLHNEPVEACPPSAGYRLGKFLRKHRVGVAAITAAIIVLLLTVTGLAISNHMLSVEQARTEAARQDEVKRRQLARRAVDAMSSQVIDGWLAQQKELLPEHKEFLKQALAWYQELAGDTGEDEASRAGVAAAHLRVGWIHYRLGQVAEAETAYREALRLFGQMTADFPTAPAYRADLATSHNNLANVLLATGRLEEAERAYGEALTLYQKLAGDFPGVPQHRRDLAGGHSNLANVWRTAGRLEDAERALRQALTLRQQLADDFPGVPEYRCELAGSHNNLGMLLGATGRLEGAEQAHRKALTLRQQLADEFPSVPAYRHDLAISHDKLGVLLGATGRQAEAEQALRQALTLGKQLADEFPSVPEYRHDLAGSHNDLGNLLRDLERREEAEREYRQALMLSNRVADDFPTIPEYRQLPALIHNNLGTALHDLGRQEEAEREYQQALTLYQRLADDFPSVPEHAQESLTAGLGADHPQTLTSKHNLALVYHAQGKHAQAGTLLMEVLEGRTARLGPDSPAAFQTAHDLHWVGVALWENGQLPEAEKAFRAALTFFKSRAAKLTASSPEFEYTRQQMGWTNFYLALVLNAAGRPREAIEEYHRTLELAPGNKVAAPNFWPRVALARLLATSSDLQLRDPGQALALARTAVAQMDREAHGWSTLGIALYRTGEWNASIDALEKAVELRRNNDAVDWLFLAMAHWQRGEKDKALQWYDRAEQWVDHAEAIVRHRGPIGGALAAPQAGPIPLLAALQVTPKRAIGEDKGHDDEELRGTRAEAAALLGLTKDGSRPNKQ